MLVYCHSDPPRVDCTHWYNGLDNGIKINELFSSLVLLELEEQVLRGNCGRPSTAAQAQLGDREGKTKRLLPDANAVSRADALGPLGGG